MNHLVNFRVCYSSTLAFVYSGILGTIKYQDDHLTHGLIIVDWIFWILLIRRSAVAFGCIGHKKKEPSFFFPRTVRVPRSSDKEELARTSARLPMRCTYEIVFGKQWQSSGKFLQYLQISWQICWFFILSSQVRKIVLKKWATMCNEPPRGPPTRTRCPRSSSRHPPEAAAPRPWPARALGQN